MASGSKKTTAKQITSLSTAKATSSTQRPQTCTEAATKYYNYIVNETDEEREHRLPTLPKATRLDQATLKVYSQNYLLRCSDRQQELCTSRISFQRTRDSRSALALFYSEQLRTTIMCDMFREALHLETKSLLNNIFDYIFHYIYFPKTIPSKIYYHCIAALYINTAVSFKSSITKIYYCWPPIFDPI